MFGSETLEVAVGLSVLFSLLSLFASSLRESIEAWLKDRAKFVHDAIAELFSTAGEADTSAIKEFYESIVISPSYRGTFLGRARNLPSYIPSRDFASALLDMGRQQAERAVPAATTANADWISKVTNPRLAQLLRVAFRTSDNDPEKARTFLEQWFDGQMERVSGWYKRRTQAILLLIGFGCALILNVDAIAITQHLYRNDALRQLIVARAQSTPRTQTAIPNAPPPAPQKVLDPAVVTSNGSTASNIAGKTLAAVAGDPAFNAPRETLEELGGYGFPIGWTWHGSTPVPRPQCALHGQLGDDCSIGPGASLLMLLGWIITAFGISLGAPFWFDLLDKFIMVRSTVKPFEKSPPAGSEDGQPSGDGSGAQPSAGRSKS